MPHRLKGVALVAALSISMVAATAVAAPVPTSAPVLGADPAVTPLALGAPTLGALPTGRSAFDRPNGPAPAPTPDQYVVELTAPPAALYRGGVQGLAPTAPATTGQPLAQRADAVRAWTRELDQRQAAVTAAVPGVKPQVEYRTALAGFAAQLDDAQVTALRAQPGVKAVVPERFVRLAATSPAAGADPTQAAAPAAIAGSEADLLGLPGGLWKRLGGAQHAGAGVIVGVVDSGITPESPSFAAGGLAPPPLFDGACEGGEEFPTTTCNNKLIGARWFVDGYGRGNIGAGEYLSPRDEVGHGTNVASIAVGDRGVDPDVQGNDLGVDRITGIAPAAHLAVYKACWQYGECSTVDVVSAIDAAVRDGVDVLNLSLGGPADPSTSEDPMEAALRNADAAGVAVAVAAGNAGSYPGAVGSPARAPWVTAVGATTGTRTFRSTLHLAAGGRTADVPVATVGPGWHGTQLFDARTRSSGFPDPFGDPRFCADGLSADDVRGRVVLCEAFAPIGIVDPYLKSLGAAGYILIGGDDAYDPELNTPLPSAFVERHDVAAIRSVTDANGGVADLEAGPGHAVPWTPDRVAPFSSRGPSELTGDLLRPDVSAPGVNTLAAYAPNTYASSFGDEGHTKYMPLSGTSMSSPQIAGVAALLTQLHPTWSGAALRSAMVTTAKPVLDGDAPANAVAAGAGRVDPQAAADPGLVFEPSQQDYADYAAGTLKAADLDLPSISVGDATKRATVERTVTSVADVRGSWTASVVGGTPDAVGASVSPRTFTIAPGQKQALAVSVSAYQGADAFQSFAVVLTNRQTQQTVRVPVAVDNPGIVDPPEAVDIAAASADGSQPLTATIAAPVNGVGLGLAAPQVHAGLETGTPEFEGLQEYTLPIALDHATPLLAADAATKDGTPLATNIYDDVDGDGYYTPVDQNALVSRSQSGDDPAQWHEADALDLPAGKYLIEVHVPEPHDQPVPFDLRAWQVDDPKPDDPSPAPGLVVDGDGQESPAAPHVFTLRFNGVSGDEDLRGLVDWQGSTADRHLGATVVRLRPAGG
ncbi:protease [Baekduia alba]|uniref:S8 family serine peptidase n=1 Tax=Baekduia alba TaxID=2997333 RepID=UPI00234152D4|nr:S8 family serine peptidase [Baekduia alba]WCB91477.1 protease [Baekduia alba]